MEYGETVRTDNFDPYEKKKALTKFDSIYQRILQAANPDHQYLVEKVAEGSARYIEPIAVLPATYNNQRY